MKTIINNCRMKRLYMKKLFKKNYNLLFLDLDKLNQDKIQETEELCKLNKHNQDKTQEP